MRNILTVVLFSACFCSISGERRNVFQEKYKKERWQIFCNLERGLMGEKDYVIFKTLQAPSREEFSDILDKISNEARAAGITEEDIAAAIQKSRK